jgi:hypothetical protein
MSAEDPVTIRTSKERDTMNGKFEDGSWAAATVQGTETSGADAVRQFLKAGLAERDNNAPEPTPGPEAPAGGFGNTWAC